jgi:hypothetical protein
MDNQISGDQMKPTITNRRLKFQVVLLLGALVLAGCNSSGPSSSTDAHGSHQAHKPAAQNPVGVPTPRVPAHFSSAAEARPFPAVLDPTQFSNPIVVKGYQFAQENPEVFAQLPCYCYCDASFQHKSLLDCFASDHSAGCELCLKEGYLAHQLTKQGKSAPEIRAQIIRGDWEGIKLY